MTKIYRLVIRLSCLWILTAVFTPSLLASNPMQLPRGIFVEKKGELRLIIDNGNIIYFQKGRQSRVHIFKLNVVARTRFEHWCENKEYSTRQVEGDMHPIYGRLKPEQIYTNVDEVTGLKTQKQSQKKAQSAKDMPTEIKTIVLGNVEAVPEDPLRPPLPEFHNKMRFIFTYSGQDLELIVFGAGLNGRIIYLKRIAIR